MKQLQMDIFLIDWEKSAGKLLPNNGSEEPKDAPVSVWRRLYVANLFYKLLVSIYVFH